MCTSSDGQSPATALLPRLANLVIFAAAFTALSVSACGGHVNSAIVTLPGLGIAGGYVGLVLPILAGVLERPFISAGGVADRTVWLSILANYISAIGATFAAVAVFTIPVFGLAVPVIAAIGIEWLLLHRLSPKPRRLLAMIAAANVLSAIVIASMPIWRAAFGTDRRDYYVHINRYQAEIGLATCAIALVVILWVIIRAGPLIFHRYNPNAVDRHPGFEVILKSPHP